MDRVSVARVYAHWLGSSKDTYAKDREVADAIARVSPLVVQGARQNRAFLGRAVTYLASQGVRQFLDVGSGLPLNGNVHEVAQRVASASRTVYVDLEKTTYAHARALLACDSRTIAIHADARDPSSILDNPAVRQHLDLDQPVAVLFVAILHFMTPTDDTCRIVKAFRDVLVPGSFVVISHVADLDTDTGAGSDGPIEPTIIGSDAGVNAQVRVAAELYSTLAAPFTLRSPSEIQALFGGLPLIPPGLVPAAAWHATPRAKDPIAPILAGIGHVTTEDTDEGQG